MLSRVGFRLSHRSQMLGMYFLTISLGYYFMNDRLLGPGVGITSFYLM